MDVKSTLGGGGGGGTRFGTKRENYFSIFSPTFPNPFKPRRPFPRVLIKCRQPAKKPATWRFEPSTFWGNRVKLGSESLKLPTALSYQAAYFNILAVYLKN